jgi:hypothetical protein
MPLDEGVAVDLAVFLRHRAVLVEANHVQGLAGNILRRIPGSFIPVGQGLRLLDRLIIRFLAGDHAGPAADTLRGVVQHADGFGR